MLCGREGLVKSNELLIVTGGLTACPDLFQSSHLITFLQFPDFHRISRQVVTVIMIFINNVHSMYAISSYDVQSKQAKNELPIQDGIL